MKKIIILTLVFFAFYLSADAKKVEQPTSKNEVKLNVEGPQLNLKAEPKKNTDNSIKLKYSTDLKEKNNARPFDNNVEQSRMQYAKTIDKKMAENPAVYEYSDEPRVEEEVLFDTETILNNPPVSKKLYQENIDDGEKKSEKVYSKTFKDNRLDVGVGTEQTFPDENQPAKSQINIGTKIRL